MSEEWIPAVIAIASAAGSLILLLFSTLLTREAKRIHDDFKSLKASLKSVMDEAQEGRRAIWEELRIASQRLSDQQKECGDKFLSQKEWERTEKLKDRLLEAWQEENRKVEENMKQAISLIQKNGRRTTGT